MLLIKLVWGLSLINKKTQENQKKTSIGTTGGAPISSQFSNQISGDNYNKQK